VKYRKSRKFLRRNVATTLRVSPFIRPVALI
jgi:hypothetical protein